MNSTDIEDKKEEVEEEEEEAIENRDDYLKNATYLIKVSNDQMNDWGTPSAYQVEFMNLYIKFFLNTGENHEYDEVGALAWAQQNNNRLEYTMCRYLTAPINRFEFPFGFYKLLSNRSDKARKPPRIIFVYGIEPKPNYLKGNKNADDHPHWIEAREERDSMRMGNGLDMSIVEKVKKRRRHSRYLQYLKSSGKAMVAATSGGKKTKKKSAKKKSAKKKSTKKKSKKRKK